MIDKPGFRKVHRQILEHSGKVILEKERFFSSLQIKRRGKDGYDYAEVQK